LADEESPLSRRVREELADKALYTSLFQYALWRTRKKEDAEDLLGDAIVCVCDPDRRPWDPAQRTLFRHMRFVMDDIAIERARTGYRRFEELGQKIDYNEVLAEVVADPRPLADEVLDDARTSSRLRLWGQRLHDRVKDRDPLAAQVLDACGLGLETAEARAAHIGCTEKEAYEAFRRLIYHGSKIVEEEAAEAERRVNEARDKAKKRGGA